LRSRRVRHCDELREHQLVTEQRACVNALLPILSQGPPRPPLAACQLRSSSSITEITEAASMTCSGFVGSAAGVAPDERRYRGKRRQTQTRTSDSITGGDTGQLAPLERDVGDPPADGTLYGTRTATDLLSVQRTLGVERAGC
jgi:hypothetical protein